MTARYERCNARHRRDPTTRCRNWGYGTGGRCRHHGGKTPPPLPHRIVVGPSHDVIRRKQKLLRAWGIRWKASYQVRTAKEAIGIMTDAIKRAEEALVTLPAISDKPDAEKDAGELLTEGLHAGLILGRDACLLARKHMQTVEDAGVLVSGEDLKILRWGTDTAGWLVRAGVRITEEGFRAKRKDLVDDLLEQIATAKIEDQTAP